MLAASTRAPLEWAHDPALVVVLLVAAGAYGRRWKRLRDGASVSATYTDLVYFALGLGILAAAWVTPLDPLGDDYLLSAHMVQKLLVIGAAPPLLLRGCTPAITAPSRRAWEPALRRVPGLSHPSVLLAVGVVVIVGWHAVPVYDAVLRTPALHVLEQVTLVLAGIAVTWPLVSAARGGRDMTGLAPVFYLVALEVGIGVMGVWLAWYPRLAYDWYGSAPRMLGLEAQTDQAVAGAILLVTEEPLLLIEFGVLFLRMLTRDEEEQLRRDAEEFGPA